ncbi:dihydrolipoyllysine-residue acetyltransferase [Alteromonas gilva]|uniref:Dihydrolipoamide acetyltransferase component of pyruvate dehydrogenase complex n=1 Tax=Alteromonas gilva TaxID=2987522 RepID=A0ABT5L1V7_9ALTE|nr:dihydrolipoyllysine-residue acetyltransferase [Alteromonas gilva]MDC8831029.1 dihydrolipoyllysine-residue acetyltransferase [Alteromonas gilva]
MTDFILPDIGEGVVECELLEWLVAEGDTVEEDQPVAEVMTDKATVQIPAMHSGVITKLYYTPGQIAKVHAPLFELQEDNGETAVPDEQVKRPEQAMPSAKADGEREPAAHHNSQPGPVQGSETFILPDIGEGIVECEIVKWHVGEGDTVNEDDVVVEVMTDKAVVEIPAKYAGVLTQRHYKVGEIARVHAPLFELATTQESAAPARTSEPASGSGVAKSTLFQEGSVAPQKEIAGKIPASPAVRRMARENNLTLADIEATGKKGRVLKQDVLTAIAARSAPALSSEDAGSAVPWATTQSEGPDKTVPLTPVQKAMARQMKRSVATIPHFTVSDELDMSGLIALKASLQDDFTEHDIKLSYMPFFIKALSLCLHKYPMFNARLSDDESALHYCSDHNIGFAVDSKAGLLVPNIKQVQRLSLLEIGAEMQRIITDARAGKVASGDLNGGTITISNVGVLGGITATPIINYPELAIVALGKIQQLPRFDEQQNVVSQATMQVSWSADHRVIDGATMVRFNNLWLDYLRQPVKMLSHLS